MPIPFTAAQIKAWFETGDFPTQQQFADMIDTGFYQNQQALDTAANAVAIATAAVPCFGYVDMTAADAAIYPGVAAYTVRRQDNCVITCIITGGKVFEFTITPTAPFDDVYPVFLHSQSTATLASTTVVRTLANLKVTFTFTTTNPVNGVFQFTIHG